MSGDLLRAQSVTLCLSSVCAERNVGRVFVYRYHPANDTWNLMDQLSPLRTQSNFGYSLDIHNTSIVVGANGYYKYQYENTQQFDARLTRKQWRPLLAVI